MEEKPVCFTGRDHFAEYVGIEITEAGPGYAVARMPIRSCHKNGVGRVQGGAIFTLADYCFAAASNTEDESTLGLSATITYFGAPVGDVLYAEAKVLSAKKKISGYEVSVLDENRDLVARFSAVGYIRKRRAE